MFKFFSARSGHNAKSDRTMSKYANVKHFMLYLYPTFNKTINTCPFASSACKKACLVGCGRGRFQNVIDARKRKTEMLANDFEGSCRQIVAEINALLVLESVKGGGNEFVFRLNGTSDIDFSKVWNNNYLFDMGVIFCEYTKNPFRMSEFLQGKFNKNVHFTFSYSGKNWNQCVEVLNKGGNVAVPFACDKLPETYKGYRVINGDLHDLRYKDEGKGVIVGLKAKGTKRDIEEGIKSGFFVKC